MAKLAASAGLSAEQVKFCHAQSDLSRKDAGLPPRYAALPAKPEVPTRPLQRPIDADCGPRARAIALASPPLSIHAEVATLRKVAGTDATGTSLAGLSAAVQSLGCKSEALQVSREALPSVPLPAVAWFHTNHYVALLKLTGSAEEGTAVIHDPNEAQERSMSMDQFLRQSGGYLLCLHR